MFSVANSDTPLRFVAILTAWGLVASGSFLLFQNLFGADEGQTELACAKAQLEAMWDVPLPADLEVVGSIPGSSVASVDWDLKDLGCSDAVYPAATLQRRQ